MADKIEAPPAPAGDTAGSGSKLMVGLTGLNSVLLVGVLAVVALRLPARAADAQGGTEARHGASAGAAEHGAADAKATQARGGGGAQAAAPERAAAMLQLPDFVVHLRDPDTDRYARLTLNVELGAEQDKEAINAHLPQIRDAFLAYLSDRTVDELRGSEGMGLVKQDLAKKLNELVPAAPVKALYVTDMVVQ